LSEESQLGNLAIELVVKLDDGVEVKAIWMAEQGNQERMRGRRVEVEKGEGSEPWRVTRILETDGTDAKSH
jgi:hypothetical protein